MKKSLRQLWRECTNCKLKYLYSYTMFRKRLPNLFCPRDYSEYICRDIFLNRNHKKAFLADKYAVRNYVAGKGLSFLLPELYGVWKDAMEIDFSALPDRFALKCNHSCGQNIICPDKNSLDKEYAVKQLNEWLKTKHPVYFESHYYRIKPLIICEEFISDQSGVFPMDYKIHCAHGVPVYIQVCYDRDENSVGKRIIYDTQWNDLHYVINDYHQADHGVEKPKNLELMLKYASILSADLEYARIDLYDLGDRVLFGEITLTPMGGWLSYFTQEALDVMGEAIRKYGKTSVQRKI